ncbi:MAG: hypothetical protein MUO31_05755 [Thermodesulfovibrionales bacterium]|nr:hypothetical protein [Thermodesulfovibrionales bacterium]
MKKKTMQKATEGNLKESILIALAKAAEECAELTGVHVRKSPEYVLNTYIVKEVCDNFDILGFRLEMIFSDVFEMLGYKPKFPSHIRKGAKFDIVLTSRNSKKPRHVIEVKRSIKEKQMVKEAKRILFVANAVHGSKRLKTGFIACVARIKKKGTPAEIVIAARVKEIENTVGDGFKVFKSYKEYEFGELGFPINERLLLVVFEIKKI